MAQPKTVLKWVLREYLIEVWYFRVFHRTSDKGKAEAWRSTLNDVRDYAQLNVMHVILNAGQDDLYRELRAHLALCTTRSDSFVAERGVSDAPPEYEELENRYVADAEVLFAELVKLLEKAFDAM